MSDHTRVILIAAIAMAILGTLYKGGDIRGWFSKRARTAAKGMATAAAAALAAYAWAQGGGRYAALMALGLLICALADMVLEGDLIAGATVFAAGHLFYITAFVMTDRLYIGTLWLWLALAAVLVIAAWITKKKTGQPVLPYTLYGILLCLMFSLACGHSLMAGTGAALFLISDLFIAYSLFVRPSTLNGVGCIVLYYTAQFLLALTTVVRL